MSVKINFYVNGSDSRTAQKSLSLIAGKDCELKGDVDVLRPRLIVTGDAAMYASCNYFEIPAFNRFYYLTGCTSVPGGMLEISGEVDPLTSAWPYLAGKSAVIERQENAFNLLLNDGTFQAYANDQVITKDFPEGFGTPAYVLIVAG